MLTTKNILKLIGCEFLSLHKGEGYWYFEYDALKAKGIYDTKSIYVMYLKDLSLEEWVAEGKAFVSFVSKED